MTVLATERSTGIADDVRRLASADLTVISGLLTLALIGFWLVRPAGEFPLNDDWAFILPVKWWVEQGRLQFTDWQFMTLIGQVAVGAAVSTITGFSITGLRWVVIGMAVGSVLLVYCTARAVGSSRSASLLVALVLLCSPILVVTAPSFMTDVPFLAACLTAVFLRVTSHGRWGGARLVLAWLFVLLACSIRQAGVALAIGFIAFDYVQRGSVIRAMRDSLLPALLVAALLVAYPKILERTIGLPSMFDQPNQEVKGYLIGLANLQLGLLLMAFKNLLVAFAYLGFGLAPLLPMIIRGESRWRRPAVAIGVATLVAIVLIAVGRATPLPGNTFFDFGLGVRTLPSSGPEVTAPPVFWWAMASIVGMGVAASLFAATSVRWNRAAERSSPAAYRNACVAMLVAILCVYNIPFLMRGGLWFDRYSLLNVALFGVLVAPFLELSRPTKVGVTLTAVMLTALFAFGIAGTHDYIEWNRQRWLAADALEKQAGVDQAQIDGGFEYNNYRSRLEGDERRSPDAIDLKRPAAVYRLALSQLPNHTVVSIRPCRTWLYGSPDKIYVLRAGALPRQ